MIPLTKARLKKYARQGWLAVILPAILLLLSITAIRHSTTKLEFRPAYAHAPIAQDLAASELQADYPSLPASYQSQAPVAQNGTFAPFLDIVPSQDGTELYISAGGVGELGGTVFANIGIGPGHDQGSYTMTFSDTVQTYIATAPGFTPGIDAHGPLSITTTLGLDTGAVDFNRAYVPASTTQTIDSIDGNLQLTVVSTDTFPSEAYVAVVPSYALPGPPPLGHRLVGNAYSVRASGARLISDKPMSLHLSYNETTLAGADPHTLAIFAWDAFNKCWDALGGTLFSTQQYLSVATSRFTTYALMATLTWRDEFDEFSGLDFSQLSNVTFGGTVENRTLVLASTPGSGSATSQPITPTTAFNSWGTLTFSRTVDPPTTTLTVDVVSLDGGEVLTDVASGTSLADLVDPVQYPSLRLRVNMESTVPGETPALERWQLSWQVATYTIYLPVVLNKTTSQRTDPPSEPPNGITINIYPPAPTERDVIRITPSGEWGDSCIPVYESHQIVGNVIRVNAWLPYPDGTMCLFIVLPWSFIVEVGPLSAGLYTVEVHIIGYSGYWPSHGTETFVVSPD